VDSEGKQHPGDASSSDEDEQENDRELDGGKNGFSEFLELPQVQLPLVFNTRI